MVTHNLNLSQNLAVDDDTIIKISNNEIVIERRGKKSIKIFCHFLDPDALTKREVRKDIKKLLRESGADPPDAILYDESSYVAGLVNF